MTERDACDRLKQRFELAGFRIVENQSFDDAGVQFEIDGYDADHRVGYEFVSQEAGDGWDVDDNGKATLAAQDDLHVLVIDEADVPDQAALDQKIDAFLAALDDKGVGKDDDDDKPAAAKKKPGAKKPAAKKPAAKKKAAKRR